MADIQAIAQQPTAQPHARRFRTATTLPLAMMDSGSRVRALVLAAHLAVLLGCLPGNPAEERVARANEQGMRHHNAGEFTEALTQFARAADEAGISSRSRAKYLRNAGSAAHELGDEKTARSFAVRAADAAPSGSFQACLNEADVHLYDDAIPHAIRALEKAHESSPTEMGPCNMLGIIYLGDRGPQFEDLDKALHYNQLAQELEPQRITLELLARTLAARGDLAEALRRHDELLSSYPEEPLYEHFRGQVLAAQDAGDRPVRFDAYYLRLGADDDAASSRLSGVEGETDE